MVSGMDRVATATEPRRPPRTPVRVHYDNTYTTKHDTIRSPREPRPFRLVSDRLHRLRHEHATRRALRARLIAFTPNRAAALANDCTLRSSFEPQHQPSARPHILVRQRRRRH